MSSEDISSKEPVSESYFRALEQRVKAMKNEHKVLLRQKHDLQKQLNEHRTELAKLKRPPLLIGTIQEKINHEQVIIKSSTGPSFLVNYASEINTADLLPGAQVVINQRHFSVISVIPTTHDPLVRGLEVLERPDITYNDIGGLSEQVRDVAEALELSIREPELFEQVGIESPKGVLLFGPPGTGKTLIAKAVAHETNTRFISVIGSELVQKYIGEGARLVREVFRYARKNSPAIIFIDELDAIGSRRLDIGTSGDREVQRTFMQLLSELDGFEPRGQVKIIAATNRPDILDPALLRPGRFDRHIDIPFPDLEGRKDIFEIHTKFMNLRKDVDLTILAELTDGSTGADIKVICTEAGMNAIRGKRVRVKHSDFMHALEKVFSKNLNSDDDFIYFN
ncbi:MAG: proteasome-activating nucleotidase [Candidatus Hodarchaeales archaeon]|jgi:proteasome regulatory subunit